MTTTATCRACGASQLEPVLSLGKTPLANALLSRSRLRKPEATFPLDLVFCPACTLVQITEAVPPEEMFARLPYFSSFSDTMVEARRGASRPAHRASVSSGRRASRRGREQRRLPPPELREGRRPRARHRAGAQRREGRGGERCPDACVEFFGSEVADELRGERPARRRHPREQRPRPRSRLERRRRAGSPRSSKDDGIAVIEVPYVATWSTSCEFDTIYHEHLCYFSLHRARSLDERARARDPRRGASPDPRRLAPRIRRARPARTSAPSASPRSSTEEAAADVDKLAFYRASPTRVNALKKELVALLADLKDKGARIAAYGAAAKGATLLNFLGIGRKTIDFVVDRSTHKQGRYMPGAHVPSSTPRLLLEKEPDYCCSSRGTSPRRSSSSSTSTSVRGGKFILPVPTVRVLEL